MRAVIWTLVAVALLSALAVGVFLFRPVGDSSPTLSETRTEKKSEKDSEEDAFGFRFPESGRTGDEILAETIVPWLEDNLRLDGLPMTDGAGIPASEWTPFVRAVIQEEIGGPNANGWASLEELAEPFLNRVRTDPRVAYLVGRALPLDHEKKKDLLALAYDGFSVREGEEILAFLAATEWAIAPVSEKDSPVEELVSAQGDEFYFYYASLDPDDPIEGVVGALQKALDEHRGFSEMHDRLAGYILTFGARGVVFDYLHEPISEVILAHPEVDLWMKKWMEGKHFHRIAWEARGGGYSSSTTADGRAIFNRNMAKARNSLDAAWAENPQHPGVAADRISMSLSQGDEESVEQTFHWFQEAAKVQVDYVPAYEACLWALRPRWHGSHREMLSFGKKCLDSGRFDSGAPWFFLQAHKDIASEWDLPSAYFIEMDHGNALDRLFTGFEEEQEREPWRRYDRTQAVMTYFFRGDYDKAADWLKRLDGEEMHPVALAEWGNPRTEWIIGKTEAFTGEFGSELDEAEENELKFRAKEAYETYEKVLSHEALDIPEAAVGYLEDRREAMRLEYFFAEKGEIENFVPTGKGDGWRSTGLETYYADKLVMAAEESDYFRVTSDAKIGPSFQMTGDIEAVNVKEGARTWISFGYPERAGKARWGMIEFVWYQDKSAVRLRNGEGAAEEVEKDLPSDTFHFSLQISAEGVTLKLNDEMIWDNVPVPRRFVKEGHSQVGFGGSFAEQGQGRIEIRNVTLQKP